MFEGCMIVEYTYAVDYSTGTLTNITVYSCDIGEQKVSPNIANLEYSINNDTYYYYSSKEKEK